MLCGTRLFRLQIQMMFACCYLPVTLISCDMSVCLSLNLSTYICVHYLSCQQWVWGLNPPSHLLTLQINSSTPNTFQLCSARLLKFQRGYLAYIECNNIFWRVRLYPTIGVYSAAQNRWRWGSAPFQEPHPSCWSLNPRALVFGITTDSQLFNNSNCDCVGVCVCICAVGMRW